MRKTVIYILILVGVTPFWASGQMCGAPCPGSYRTKFEADKKEAETTCFPKMEMALAVCDLDKQKEILALQKSTREKFQNVLDGGQKSLSTTCQVFSRQSNQLRNQLGVFMSSCQAKRNDCLLACEEALEKIEKNRGNAQRVECCRPLVQEVDAFLADKLKPWNTSCVDQQTQLANAKFEQTKWIQLSGPAGQCYTRTTEPSGGGFGTAANSKSSTNKSPLTATNPVGSPASGSQGVESQKETVQGRSAEARRSGGDSNAEVRQSQRAEMAKTKALRRDQKVDQKMEEVVDNMLSDFLNAKKTVEANQKKRRGLGSASSSSLGKNNEPLGHETQMDGKAAAKNLVTGLPKEMATRSPASVGELVIRWDEDDEDEKYEELIEYRKSVAGKNEFVFVDGITASHGQTIWQKISERYQDLKSGLAE